MEKSVFGIILLIMFVTSANDSLSQLAVGPQKYYDTYQSLLDNAGDSVFVYDIVFRNNYIDIWFLDRVKLLVYKIDGQWVGRHIKYYWDNGCWVVDICVESPLFSDNGDNVDSLFEKVVETIKVLPEELETNYSHPVITNIYCKIGREIYKKQIEGNMRNIQRQYPSVFAFVSWAYFESFDDIIDKSIRFLDISDEDNMHINRP